MKGTIKSPQTISWLFENGTKFSSASFLALYSKSSDGKVAFIAGKKLGNAPLRSKAKRRLREALKSSEENFDGYNVVFVARKGTLDKSYEHLVKEIKRLAGQIYKDSQENTPNEGKTKKEKPQGLFKTIGLALVGIPRTLALLCIKLYRHAISPLFPPSCRYVPTCSEYALIAIERFGFWKGLLLATKRVGRCHPLAEGGYDPVPEK